MTLSRANNSLRPPRSDEDLARMIVSVVEATQVDCMLTNPDIHDALVELSKLDGAFVLRGDGFIQAAGVFLIPPPTEVELVSGLGARHAAAAAATMRTTATTVVVSATDGNVRVFSGSKLVLQIDPDVAHGHISMNE